MKKRITISDRFKLNNWVPTFEETERGAEVEVTQRTPEKLVREVLNIVNGEKVYCSGFLMCWEQCEKFFRDNGYTNVETY